jgi:hypothetical protein
VLLSRLNELEAVTSPVYIGSRVDLKVVAAESCHHEWVDQPESERVQAVGGCEVVLTIQKKLCVAQRAKMATDDAETMDRILQYAEW